MVQVHKKPSLRIGDLTVRHVFGRPRVPRIIGNLHLPVVVAEGNIVEPVGEDRTVQLVFCDGREPFVLDGRCETVGHEHVIPFFCDLDLVIRNAVVLGPEHVRDQVEDRVTDLDMLVPEAVRSLDPGMVVREDFKR